MACIFCDIVDGKINADFVIKNEKVVAFKDINPKAPHHILVIPKRHVESITEFYKYPEDVVELHKTITQVVDKLSLNSFRVVVNNGPDAGQAIYHLHYHILSGRKLGWPPG
ncbi:MAG: HIT domain-containing protein [bacterium]|nr:HIT domain-containing protein [bacterium]